MVTATFFVFLYHFYLPVPATMLVSSIISYISVELSLFFQLFLTVVERTLYLMLIYYLLRKYFPRMTSVIVWGGKIKEYFS